MITIIVHFLVKQGKKEEFHKAMEELLIKSREEEGCLLYDIYEGRDDTNSVVLLEHWKDQVAIDIHGKTDHFMTIIPRIKEIASIDIKFYNKLG